MKKISTSTHLKRRLLETAQNEKDMRENLQKGAQQHAQRLIGAEFQELISTVNDLQHQLDRQQRAVRQSRVRTWIAIACALLITSAANLVATHYYQSQSLEQIRSWFSIMYKEMKGK